MEKEFIPFELSLKMKQLGFDEPCFAFYNYNSQLCRYMNPDKDWNNLNHQQLKNSKITIPNTHTAPTFSQAFRWFREKYNLKGHVEPVEYLDGTPDTYHWSIFNNCNSGNDQLTHEEAELACLEKLIEIVEEK
jgi:hypothetical protein